MKKISHWARQYPRRSIALIITLHLLAGLNAVVLGSQLFAQGWIAPRWLVLTFVHLFFLAYVLYPRKQASRWSLPYSYYRQKALDFTLVLAASLTIALGISRLWMQMEPSPRVAEASFINYHPAGKEAIENNKRVTKLKLRAKLKQVRKQLRKDLREIRKSLKKQQNRKKRNWTRFLLILSGGIVILGLALLLAGLSCSIACSGQEGLALIVFFGGLAGLIWLAIIAIKAMDQKYPIILKEEDGTTGENLN